MGGGWTRRGEGRSVSVRAKVYARMICSRFLIPLINPLSLIIAFLSRSFFVALDRAPRCAPAARAIVLPGNSIPAAFFCFDGEQWAGRSFYALSGLANGLLTIITSLVDTFFFFWPVIEFREGWIVPSKLFRLQILFVLRYTRIRTRISLSNKL